MFVVISLAAVGAVISFGAVLVAQATTDGGAVANYIQGGGSAAAVAGLVYVARQLVNGNLIARPTSVVEQELVKVVKESLNRDQDLVELTKAAVAREERLNTLVERNIEALTKAGSGRKDSRE